MTMYLIRSQSHYYHTKDPQFHQDAYAVLTAVVVFSNMWIMEKHVRPGLEGRQAKRPPGSALPSANAMLKQMWHMVITGPSWFTTLNPRSNPC